MNRRGFLGSMLALGAAPAIVRADALMQLVPVQSLILRPQIDIAAVTALIREIKAYDINRDEFIYRLDFAGHNRQGELRQIGIDFTVPPGDSIERSREPALAILKAHAAGLVPAPGVLTIPDGVVFGRFI